MKKPVAPRPRPIPAALRTRIRKHATWLRTKGAKGRRLSYDEGLRIDLAGQCLRRIKGHRGAFLFCNLDGADLSGADLAEADFGYATCRGTNFSGANLTRATFTGTDLEGANLAGATLDECLAFGTNFTNAAFSGTSLRGSTLAWPRINRGMSDYMANLHTHGLKAMNRPVRTRISQAQIDGCCCDRLTSLPKGLRRRLKR
jgi:uncharacterized protein YjbI with pentapeptide repeats